MPLKDKMAIAVCMGSRPLPISFFDDTTIQWAFGFQIFAKTVKDEVISLYCRIQEQVKVELSNKKGTLAIDGWTNPVTKQKHICVVAQPILMEHKIYFVSSTVMQDELDADALMHFLIDHITELQSYGFTTIGIVGDNARAQQAAISRISDEFPSICQIPCGVHTMNLVLKSIITQACRSAVQIVEKSVNKRIIKRYVETRWNSIYDKVVELQGNQNVSTSDENNELQRCEQLLKPVINLLNYSQKNH